MIYNEEKMLYPARWKKITVDQSKVLKNLLFRVFGATRYIHLTTIRSHHITIITVIIITSISCLKELSVRWRNTYTINDKFVLNMSDVRLTIIWSHNTIITLLIIMNISCSKELSLKLHILKINHEFVLIRMTFTYNYISIASKHHRPFNNYNEHFLFERVILGMESYLKWFMNSFWMRMTFT